jgi:hypothetical protein
MTDLSVRGDAIDLSRVEAVANLESKFTPEECRRAAIEIIELRSIACAAMRLVDAQGRTTGPMWQRLANLLLDRVRRGLQSTIERERIDPRTGRETSR